MNSLNPSSGLLTPLAFHEPLPKVRTIQFGGPGCLLESQIVMSILQYDMGGLFRKFLCLSPQWHKLVLEAMDDHCK